MLAGIAIRKRDEITPANVTKSALTADYRLQRSSRNTATEREKQANFDLFFSGNMIVGGDLGVV